MKRISVRVGRGGKLVPGVLLALFVLPALAPAQSVSLSLNVFPTNLAAPNSGGTWTLVAVTPHALGISAIDAYLTGINTAGVAYGPGINATTDGGNPFIIPGNPVNLFYFQDTTVPGLVFGVGAPTFSPGPDPLGNAAFANATKIAMGTYSSTVPAFSTAIGTTDANLFGSMTFPFGVLDPATTAVVRVSTGALAGDYSNNMRVDAADYTLWRDNLGANITLPNDTTPGSVTNADLTVWRNNFGQSISASAATAVPEPAAGVILLLLAGRFGWLRKASHVGCDVLPR